MNRRKGNVGDLLTTGICVLAMVTVMLACFECVELLNRKAEVSQLARKYILRMETVGCLLQEDCTVLTMELEALGVTDIDYGGTTINAVSYGHPIALEIRGKLKGEYAFAEKRVSTAKN